MPDIMLRKTNESLTDARAGGSGYPLQNITGNSSDFPRRQWFEGKWCRIRIQTPWLSNDLVPGFPRVRQITRDLFDEVGNRFFEGGPSPFRGA